MFETGTASNYLDLLSKLDTFLTTTGSAFGVGYAGTGDGALTAYKGGTASVAETFTIAATSSTNFTVTGSMSGSLSAATVGTPYTGTKIQFTLTAGGTAFASGDTFTVSTAPKWTTMRRAMGAICTATNTSSAATHPNNAIDGIFDTGHYWTGVGALPWQFNLTFFEAETIVEYAISAGLTGASGVEPKSWTFEYWNGSTWTVLDTRTNIAAPGANVTNVYVISSPVSATQYRLNFSASNSGTSIGLIELSLRRATGGFNAANGQCIWMAPGNDGLGQFYCGARPMERSDQDWQDWELLSFDGYTSSASIDNQPGVYRNVWLPLWSSSIPYWFIANGRRVIIVAKLSTQYEAAYLGCYNPYFTPSQLPYPVCIGGSFYPSVPSYSENTFSQTIFRYSNSTTNHKAFPLSDTQGQILNYYGQFRLRKLDGTWQSFAAAQGGAPSAMGANYSSTYSTLWPYAGGVLNLDTNANGSYSVYPIMLCDAAPNNYGELDGVVAISGQGASAESTITVGKTIYMMLPNISRTSREDFYAVRLD